MARSRFFEVRIAVRDAAEVARARTRVELREQVVAQRRALRLADRAFRVVQVAEDDRARRTGGLAGGDDLSVADAPAFLFRGDPRAGDALQAVGALLHHPAHAHRHFGILLRLEGLGVLLGVLEEIEAPHLVRAVLRAKARADAAVVDLHVEAFRIVHRGADRAD